jgi:hypothetical protein
METGAVVAVGIIGGLILFASKSNAAVVATTPGAVWNPVTGTFIIPPATNSTPPAGTGGGTPPAKLPVVPVGPPTIADSGGGTPVIPPPATIATTSAAAYQKLLTYLSQFPKAIPGANGQGWAAPGAGFNIWEGPGMSYPVKMSDDALTIANSLYFAYANLVSAGK